MTWANVDDLFPEHPKVLAAGGDAAWLYVCGLCFTNRNLTEGRIPKAVVPRLSDRKGPMRLAAKLVDVGLWHDQGDHFAIHDWERYNENADEVKARKEHARNAARARWNPKPKPSSPDAQPMPGGIARSLGGHQSGTCPPSDRAMPSHSSPSSSRSSSKHQAVGMPSEEEEDFDRTAKATAAEVARRRLDIRDGPPIIDTRAWLQATAQRVYDEHGDEFRAGACNGDSIEAMVDRLMPRSRIPDPYAEPLAGEFVEVLDDEGRLIEAKWVAS